MTEWQGPTLMSSQCPPGKIYVQRRDGTYLVTMHPTSRRPQAVDVHRALSHIERETGEWLRIPVEADDEF